MSFPESYKQPSMLPTLDQHHALPWCSAGSAVTASILATKDSVHLCLRLQHHWLSHWHHGNPLCHVKIWNNFFWFLQHPRPQQGMELGRVIPLTHSGVFVNLPWAIALCKSADLFQKGRSEMESSVSSQYIFFHDLFLTFWYIWSSVFSLVISLIFLSSDLKLFVCA